MTGRGIGRGTGRLPARSEPAAVALTTVTETPAQPSVTAAPGSGRGRGIARTLVSAAVTSTPAPVATQESKESATSVPVGRGRGILARPRSDTAGVAEVPTTTAAQAPAVPVVPADQRNVAEQLRDLTLSRTVPPSAVIAPAVQSGTGRGDAAQTRALPKDGSRPTDVPEGVEGVLMERARREKELSMTVQPVGKVGKKTNLLSNVVHFEAGAQSMVYEYRVDFYPQTWSPRLRPKLIGLIENQLPGSYLFDFDNLFLPAPLPQEEQVFVVTSPFDPTKEFKLTIRRVMSNRANESKELLNLLVKELEIAMKFTQIGRNRYNAKGRVGLKQGDMPALEIWPGFQTSVNPFAGGVLLMTDPAFRVVRVGTVKGCMDNWRKSNPREENFQKMIKDNLVGSTVLTPYNDKSYVVHEIDWAKTPADTFKTRDGGDITYVQYYRQHHNIDITDLKQPLMFSRPAPTGVRRDNRLIALIPELCQLTGIQDDLRANFNAMKAITTTTKLSPQKRYDYIMEYLHTFVGTDVAQNLMQTWGIKVGQQLISVPGRILPPESIQFGGKRALMTVPANGDWTRDATGTHMLGNLNLNRWTLIFQSRFQDVAVTFDQMLRKVGSGLGMQVAEPHILPLNSDNNIAYVNSVDTAVRENKSEMVVLIFPTPRDDRYAAVKKACYISHGVASQCINMKTLSRPDRLQAIVQKIALQMNCKLGGYLWRMGRFAIPTKEDGTPKKLMVVGVDAYHDLKRQRESVTAMVASTDDDFTRWHSRCNFQNPKTELAAGLKVSFMSALNSFVKANKVLPDIIVIFRDGLSDNELDQAVTHEFPQIMEVCRDPTMVVEALHESSSSDSSSGKSEPEYNPQVYFVVVQKRINQRLFLVESAGGKQNLANPKPGTVVDEVITRRDMYDFYLVPQNVREGSVTPVHFIVVHQPVNPLLSVDHIQNLAYKLTHMYYNWTGTIRVPAPCMYAHKLAYQSGACYDRTEPNIALSDKLFFL